VTDIDRILADRMNRRGFMRMAGATTLAAAVLAACKKAETRGGGQTGTAGGSVHPPIEEEPGDLQVFDWAGYGDGYYYPKLEPKNLWGDYKAATGDTPQFTLFENDDAAYTKAVAGTVKFDVVHPCGYKYKDWVDLGAVKPWDTSLISNFSSGGSSHPSSTSTTWNPWRSRSGSCSTTATRARSPGSTPRT
jgi:spermidine/putrescine-binding protein